MKKEKANLGQGLVEYVLILALISLGVAATLELTGYSVRDAYCAAAEGLGATNACADTRVYCEDDFSSMDDWDSQYGKWSSSDDQMCTSRGAKAYSTCAETLPTSDYTVNLDGAQLDRGNGYGVFFRGSEMDGKTNGYIVQYDPGWGGGAIIMRKWVNGRELPPFAVQRMPGFDWTGEPHDIQLDVQGDTFTVSIDGAEILVGQDDTYSEGTGVGLRSWDGTEVCFDGMSVTELSDSGAE